MPSRTIANLCRIETGKGNEWGWEEFSSLQNAPTKELKGKTHNFHESLRRSHSILLFQKARSIVSVVSNVMNLYQMIVTTSTSPHYVIKAVEDSLAMKLIPDVFLVTTD